MNKDIALGLLGLAFGGALICFPASAQEPAVTPYRPTVSNPADLPAPGFLESEFGALSGKGGGFRRRDSIPVLLKYGFTENAGLLFGGEGRVRLTGNDGERAEGGGDSVLLLKLRHPLTKKAALGLEAGYKFATAKKEIGSGKNDAIMNGIASIELNGWQIDANLGVTRLGLETTGESRHAYNLSLAAAHAIAQDWNAAAEVSGVSQKGVPVTSQYLMALAYSFSKTIVLDCGAAWGLSRAATDRQVFAGMSVLWK